jgi:transposase
MNQHIERVELKEFAQLIRESFRQLFRLATRRKGLAYAKHRFVTLRVRSQRRKHTQAHVRFPKQHPVYRADVNKVDDST